MTNDTSLTPSHSLVFIHVWPKGWLYRGSSFYTH